MRKTRDDSPWNQLNSAQRDAVDDWLFKQNLGYKEIHKRVRSEFGLDVSLSSVGRYYRRRAGQRQSDALLSQLTAFCMSDLKLTAQSARGAALKSAGTAALGLAAINPGQTDRFVPFVRLLIQNERNELQRSRLELAQRVFEYKATTAVAKDFPHARACLMAIQDNESLSEVEKLKCMTQLLLDSSEPDHNTSQPSTSENEP